MRKDGVFRRPLAWLKERSPGAYRFLTRSDKPYPLIREALAVVTGLIVLVSLLWGLTGQPLYDSPVVVIESGSMMHCDQGAGTQSQVCQGPFGRLGTIDPGDLVFVKDIDRPRDVRTFCQAADCQDIASGNDYLEAPCRADHHGSCGDVIIFIPDGDTRRTPIIHRAMVWVEVHGDGRFSIDGCGLHNVARTDLSNVCLARLGITGLDGHRASSWDALGPEGSGYITRGDNNDGADHPAQNAELPVRPDWVLGKARGEVPWVGLVKLFVTDLFGGSDNFAKAPGDTKVMMWVVVGVLLGVPFAAEQVVRWRDRRRDAEDDEPEPPGQR